VLVAALVALGGAAQGQAPRSVGDQVDAIEAVHGNEPPEVIARLKPLEAAARAAGGDDLRRFLAAWGYAHGAMDRFTVAEAATAELLQIGERKGDAAAMASGLTLRATLLQFSGRQAAAYDWVRNALPWAEKTQDEPLRYWVAMSAADMALQTGHLKDGLRHLEAAGRAAVAQQNLRRQAQVFVALAPVRLALGQLEAARRDALQADALALRSETPHLRVAAKVIESLVETEAQRPAARDAAFAEARRLAQGLDAQGWGRSEAVNPASGGPRWFSSQVQVLQQLTDLNLSARRFDLARRYAERALPLAEAERASDPDAVDRARIGLGLAQIGQGQLGAGTQHVEAGLAALRQRARKVVLLEQLHRHADLLAHVGQGAAALQQGRAALALEGEILRSDGLNTVLDLQRQSSLAQQERALDALRFDNEKQAALLARRDSEVLLIGGLAVALALASGLSVLLVHRSRKSNRLLQAHNAELAHVSRHDRVTGLPNRRALEEHVKALEATGFTGLGLSIKRFGLIVGSLGHQVGDELLGQVAERLRRVIEPAGGTLYRLDGLSFGVVLPKGAQPLALAPLLDAIQQAMKPVFVVQHQELSVTLGIGAAEYPKDGATTPDVARAIQFAMRRAQSLAGTRAVIYTDDLMHRQRDLLQLESQLAQALERGEFELVYQPQCALRDRRLVGFEALLRWRSPQGPVGPDRFIPVAEESGLIVPIGRWVLTQACRQAKAWHDAGWPELSMAVNISPRQFAHPEFRSMVQEALQLSGVAPAQVELEITEGAVMDDADAAIEEMRALRDMGLQLAIDDFGTGHASLAYLKRFPINRLKIDRSFVHELAVQRENAAIVRAVVQLGHSLGLSVVAEGVEQPQEERFLREWGCDLMQGYLFARPMPAEAASAMLAQQSTPPRA
jgi:diguanylate cyclase (GGDEF)-like protein